MTEDEKTQVLEGLTSARDTLQATMHEARGLRTQLQLGNVDKCRDFLQKIGELSFAFGAAIIPLVVVTHSSEKVSHIPFVLAGVLVYLLNGMLALWKSKLILEQNADDAPHVGLDEEIHTYPVIHAHNKLLFDLENKDYQQEYKEASINVLEWAPTVPEQTKPKVSIWLDVLLINFVAASLLVVRALWPYSTTAYWLAFAAVMLFMAILTLVGYMRSWKAQLLLQAKRQTLAGIKADYQKWHNKNVLGGQS